MRKKGKAAHMTGHNRMIRSLCRLAIFVLLISDILFSQQKFIVIFSPPIGNRIVYRLDTTIQVTGTDFQDKEISMGATAAGKISMTVKRKVGDLVFMGISTPGIEVDAGINEEPQNYLLRTKENMALQATFNRKGIAQDVHNMEALNKEEIWNISLDRIILDTLPALAGKAVSIGESWSDHQKFLIPFQGLDLKVLIDRTYVLENVVAAP